MLKACRIPTARRCFLMRRLSVALLLVARVIRRERRLEYNNGVLVLTSNRGGTLDEAFKSRIQK